MYIYKVFVLCALIDCLFVYLIVCSSMVVFEFFLLSVFLNSSIYCIYIFIKVSLVFVA